MELWLLFPPTMFFPLLAPVVILGLETHSVEVYSRDILPGLYGPMVELPSLSHHHWQLDALTETGNPAAKHCYNSLLPPYTLLLPPPDSSFVLVV